MRRNGRIELKATAAVAALLLLTACGQDDWTAQKNTAVCVDSSGKRVPDADCDHQTNARTDQTAQVPFVYPYSYYYLGRGSAIPAYGEVATGGSVTRTSGAAYYHAPIATAVTSEEASVSRGGLGASAHGLGEGGGGFGEGSHGGGGVGE